MNQKSIDDLISFKNEKSVLYTRDGKYKSLYITLSGSFEIWLKGELLQTHMQPFSAIEAYNNLGGHQL